MEGYLEKEREEIRCASGWRLLFPRTIISVVSRRECLFFLNVFHVSGVQCFHTPSINNLVPKPKKILQLLRPVKINNDVFVKVTKATEQML